MTATATTAAILGMTQPHARAHLRTMQISDRVDRIAVWDPDRSALDAVMAEQG